MSRSRRLHRMSSGSNSSSSSSTSPERGGGRRQRLLHDADQRLAVLAGYGHAAGAVTRRLGAAGVRGALPPVPCTSTPGRAPDQHLRSPERAERPPELRAGLERVGEE